MNVIILPKVLEYLDSLVFILFEKEYFGFLETSINYVDELIDEIKTTLPICLHKPAPKYFDKYGKGMKYAVFRKSRCTAWYAFFKKYEKDGETIYLVRYIANNHTIAQYLY